MLLVAFVFLLVSCPSWALQELVASWQLLARLLVRLLVLLSSMEVQLLANLSSMGVHLLAPSLTVPLSSQLF